MRSALAARRSAAGHGPLERVVRRSHFEGTSGYPHFGHTLEFSSDCIQRLAGSLDNESHTQRVPHPGQRIDLQAKNIAPSPSTAPPSWARSTKFKSGWDLNNALPMIDAVPPRIIPKTATRAFGPCPVRLMTESCGDIKRPSNARVERPAAAIACARTAQNR